MHFIYSLLIILTTVMVAARWPESSVTGNTQPTEMVNHEVLESDINCGCFSSEDLDNLMEAEWIAGWWSDLDGCRMEPYQHVKELWITYKGQEAQEYKLNIVVGEIQGQPIAATSIYNQTTGRYDLQCGGYTTRQISEPCIRIMGQFLAKLKQSRNDWNYCHLLPQ